MKYRHNKTLFTVSALSFSLLSAFSAHAAQAEMLIERKQATVQGKTYQFEKKLDARGQLIERVTLEGKPISRVPAAAREIGAPKLLEKLAKASETELIEVNIALRDVVLPEAIVAEEGSFDIEAFSALNHRINGRVVHDAEALRINEREQQRTRELRDNRQLALGKQMREFAARFNLSAKPEWQRAAEKGLMTVNTKLSARELKALIASADADAALAGVELAFPVKDVVNNAMLDTNITNWALPFSTTRGAGIGIYMTESGCADEAGRANYDRLSGSQTNHSQNVFGILRAVSPQSYIYCRGGAVLPENSDLDGVNGNPAIRIISRSNGGNDSTSYSTLDRDWDNFAYTNNIAIFNAAGNEGTGTGNTISPAKGHGVIAVGNYVGTTDTISASSSFVNPQTKNAKPELSAPGTNITAGGFTMSGTSMATPHASAFLADMMSGFPGAYLGRPHLAYASMIAGATDAIAGGVDKVGVGGIDFLSAYYNGSAWYWQGNNASFSGFDSGDGAADGYITKTTTLTAGQNVRIAIAWMNRGTWTYDHKSDAHPIGQDLDLTIVAPNGSVIASSASYDNAYEVANFTVSTTGTYKVRVKRFANRDTSANFRLGMAINVI